MWGLGVVTVVTQGRNGKPAGLFLGGPFLGLKKDHYKGRVGQKYVLKCPPRCQRAGSDQIGDMLSSESQI